MWPSGEPVSQPSRWRLYVSPSWYRSTCTPSSRSTPSPSHLAAFCSRMPALFWVLGIHAPMLVRSLLTLPWSFSAPMTAERTRLGSALAVRSSHSAAERNPRITLVRGVSERISAPGKCSECWMVYSSGGSHPFTFRIRCQFFCCFCLSCLPAPSLTWLPWMCSMRLLCSSALASTKVVSQREGPIFRHLVRAVCTMVRVDESPSRPITVTSETAEFPSPRFSTIHACQSIGNLEQIGLSTMKRKASLLEMSSLA
mmetsp:Transcript_41823/g.69854  ORF Transcript_41823/g.69854 Transcript_41823/m.69854 type:complete len:255 (+) Transcript_41823:710-1474(+)